MCYSKQFVHDWATLQNLAEENFGRGRAILARVPKGKSVGVWKMAVWSYWGRWQLWRCFPLLQKLRVGVDFYAWRSEYSTASMSLFVCGVVFSFPRLRYKDPSTCSIFFRLPLLEKISPNRLVCIFFGLPSSPSCRRKRVVFSTPGRAFFHSETPDRALLAYLLQIFCRIFQLFL